MLFLLILCYGSSLDSNFQSHNYYPEFCVPSETDPLSASALISPTKDISNLAIISLNFAHRVRPGPFPPEP